MYIYIYIYTDNALPGPNGSTTSLGLGVNSRVLLFTSCEQDDRRRSLPEACLDVLFGSFGGILKSKLEGFLFPN